MAVEKRAIGGISWQPVPAVRSLVYQIHSWEVDEQIPELQWCGVSDRNISDVATSTNRVSKIQVMSCILQRANELIAARIVPRTELEKRHKHHVVNAWMGHGSTVAAKQVTEEDWAEALAENGGDAGGDIPADQQSSRMKKPCEMQAIDDSGQPVNSKLAPPPRFEHVV